MLDLTHMDSLSTFSTIDLVTIYFFYGLAFFVTGVVVWLEASRSSDLPLTRALSFLAAFGVIHGAHEWIEMFRLMAPEQSALVPEGIQILVLAVSFYLLVEFGLRLLALGSQRGPRLARWIILAVFLAGEVSVWALWGHDRAAWAAAADTWCRYSLAVPGALLAAVGLFRQGRRLAQSHGSISRDLLVVGLAFFLYGTPGQVFVRPSPLPPATVVNTALFTQVFQFPVELLRSLMASTIAIFTVRALRLFELERRRHVEKLNQARLTTGQRLAEEMAERERLRRGLLRQVVHAQEEERQHIARELHDETGQALTALSWGLAAVGEEIPGHLEVTRQRVEELRGLTEQVMADLRHLIALLRPSVLDELGLVAALITYADDSSSRFAFVVDVDVSGHRRRLPAEIETTLYRIAQEALTNVAKHTRATHVQVHLDFEQDQVTLSVSDDGAGMDVKNARRAAANGTGWGLAGVYERVKLVNGSLDIRSSPDIGTELVVRIPTPSTLTGVREEREPIEADPSATRR